MKAYQEALGSNKEVILVLSREEGKRMIDVYEEYVQNNKRKKKVKEDYEFLHHALPVW